MLIFFDTEFTNLGIDPRLISIGLVSEDGERSFYAELSNTYQLSDVGDFARLAVLPKLEGSDALVTLHELGERLVDWLQTFGEPVTLATDSLTWDWPWIHEVFGELGIWPDNLAARPLLLTMNYLIEYDRYLGTVETAFHSLRRHHALDDAQANRLGWIAAGGDSDQETRAAKVQEYRDRQFLGSDAFEHELASDYGEAAKQHLAAGRAIYYRDPDFTDGIVKKYPDGRRQLVRIGPDYAVAVVRDLF